MLINYTIAIQWSTTRLRFLTIFWNFGSFGGWVFLANVSFRLHIK